MSKCTRPIDMKDGKYVTCGKPAKYEVGMWLVCEDCKPIADSYSKYKPLEGEVNEEACIREHA